jgi:hypothetical protein
MNTPLSPSFAEFETKVARLHEIQRGIFDEVESLIDRAGLNALQRQEIRSLIQAAEHLGFAFGTTNGEVRELEIKFARQDLASAKSLGEADAQLLLEEKEVQ